jgi:hypothetical protein
MIRIFDPSDARLLAALDTERSDSWRTLLSLDQDFRQRPNADDDCVWLTGYPQYSARVDEACRVLAEIQAVSPEYPWADLEPLAFDAGKETSPADAIRLATTIVRGERFCDGNIAQAMDEGRLQAVVAALAGWYRDRPGSDVD